MLSEQVAPRLATPPPGSALALRLLRRLRLLRLRLRLRRRLWLRLRLRLRRLALHAPDGATGRACVPLGVLLGMHAQRRRCDRRPCQRRASP